jgi:cyclophilin family peptidyl-prolyl cis-trans isomerase
MLNIQCSNSKKKTLKPLVKEQKNEEVKNDTLKNLKEPQEKEEKTILLNDQNAIPFFFNYQKKNLEDKVRISTRFGDIDIQLYKNTPYHRANFIYLTKKGYFNGSTFHRVVPNFIIQGGNSDRAETADKRRKIGKYLLPPDTRKGYKHHRGVISMPSSEIENPHKLASPYEFFIVQQSPGAYHLDGSYTAFGKVIKGMDVVDKINKQKVDNREAPLTNIHMQVSIIK